MYLYYKNLSVAQGFLSQLEKPYMVLPYFWSLFSCHSTHPHYCTTLGIKLNFPLNICPRASALIPLPRSIGYWQLGFFLEIILS